MEFIVRPVRAARRAIRVAKALCSDARVPRVLRWMLRVALAIKLVPLPDFGIDEVLLVIVGAVLMIWYRPLVRYIVAETS